MADSQKKNYWVPVGVVMLGLIVVLLIAIFIKAGNQDEQVTYLPYQPTKGAPVIKPDTAEVAALKAQLETMKDYDQRMIGTVYWALGFVGGLTVVLVGISWWNNRYLLGKEKEIMRKEIRELLQDDYKESLGTIRDQLNRELAASNNAFRDNQKTEAQAIIDDLNQKIDVIDEKNQIAIFKTRARYDKINSTFGKVHNRPLMIASARQAEIGNLIKLLRFSSTRAKAEEDIKVALDRMQDAINQITEGNYIFDPNLFVTLAASTREVFAELPEGYAEVSSDIIRKMEKLGERDNPLQGTTLEAG